MSATRQHAGPPGPARPELPQPSLAERARTLTHIARLGTLCTLSRKHPGFPFGSLMPYALDDRGRPIFLISSMAVHSQNLQADPRASLFVTQPGIAGDPLGSARITLIGHTAPAGSEVRELYLKRYENARSWIDFDDFSLVRLDIQDVYFIGGFGVMGWIPALQYESASPDPLADVAPRIIEHMNQDHRDSLVLLARAFTASDADQARILSVDRLGFELHIQSGERVHGARVNFPEEVRTMEESRKVLIEMTQKAAAMLQKS